MYAWIFILGFTIFLGILIFQSKILEATLFSLIYNSRRKFRKQHQHVLYLMLRGILTCLIRLFLRFKKIFSVSIFDWRNRVPPWSSIVIQWIKNRFTIMWDSWCLKRGYWVRNKFILQVSGQNCPLVNYVPCSFHQPGYLSLQLVKFTSRFCKLDHMTLKNVWYGPKPFMLVPSIYFDASNTTLIIGTILRMSEIVFK